MIVKLSKLAKKKKQFPCLCCFFPEFQKKHKIKFKADAQEKIVENLDLINIYKKLGDNFEKFIIDNLCEKHKTSIKFHNCYCGTEVSIQITYLKRSYASILFATKGYKSGNGEKIMCDGCNRKFCERCGARTIQCECCEASFVNICCPDDYSSIFETGNCTICIREVGEEEEEF